MHAVVIDQGRLLWEERPDPVPEATELLVAVRAAGINAADLMQRAGTFPPLPGASPDVPGMEMAGDVLATGRSVRRFTVGDRVMGLVGGGGAHASMAVVDETHALSVPEGLSWSEAGGFCEAYCTALDALFRQCGLAIGDRALVTGAAGGVGIAGVQLAAAAGAQVIASVRDRRRHHEVAALGATEVVVPEEVAGHGPYDVVLELVGATSLPAALRALGAAGRVAVIGISSGSHIELDLAQLMGSQARIAGSTLRSRDRREMGNVVAAVGANVVPLLAAGRVRVPVCDAFPMAEAEAGYARFAAGGKLGKVVLLPPSPRRRPSRTR
ncbi:MAG: zinc-binding dehydrogenase [Acidimicrobiales bacterium]